MMLELTQDDAMNILRCIDKCLPSGVDGDDPGLVLMNKIQVQMVEQNPDLGEEIAPGVVIARFDFRVN